MDEKLNTGEIYATKKGFLAWLDNFWYHYKWHSIAALFLIFTISICSFQMCQKESYDIHILYAGNHAFSRQSVDADTPEYIKAKNTLSHFVSDYDKNGDVNVSFRDLFIPREDEMKDLSESEYSRAYDDRTALSTLMISGEHFLCFLDPEIYEYYKDSGRLTNLKTIVPDGKGFEYYDDTGMAISLSSTAFYSVSGFSDLPSDTLICMRSTGYSTHLNKKSNQQAQNRAKETLIKILSFS